MSLYLNFRGTFTNSGGHTNQIFQILVIRKFLLIFLLKFELDVDISGSRRDVDDSEVVSAGALVLNSPANLLFLY